MEKNEKLKFFAFSLIAFLLVFIPINLEAQKVVVIQGVDAVSLDPHAAFIPATAVVYSNIFDSLFSRDRDLKIINRLATSYEIITPTEWRIHLRKGVTFHDGEPFNAEAVKFSFEKIFAPDSKSVMKGTFITIDRIEIVNDYTVDIITKKQTPFFQQD
jgi:peptide/nickel transport system substrate-binding protein